MSAELMKWKFVRRPSIHPSSIRLWNQLSLNLLHGFLSNFGSCFPWATCPDVLKFWKKIFFFLAFLRIFLFFVNVGPYGSKKIQNATSPFNYFCIFSNLIWNFFSVVHTKVLFWIFEMLSLWFFAIFFFVFVNMGPYGSQNFKTPLLP